VTRSELQREPSGSTFYPMAFLAAPRYRIKPPLGINPSLYSVRWSHDGKLLAAAVDDGRIRVYDGNTGRTKYSLFHVEEGDAGGGGSSSNVTDDSHHPMHRNSRIGKDASMAAAAAAHAASQAAAADKGINHATIALRFSPLIQNGSEYTLLSASSNGMIRHWKISQGESAAAPFCTRETALGNTSVAFCLDYDNTGKRFAAGCKDAAVRVFDEETGAALCTLDGGEGAEFAPAERLARELPSADYAMKVINAANAAETAGSLNREKREVQRHSNRVYSVKFAAGHTSHIENLVLSAGWDRNLMVWDLRTSAAPVKSFFGVYLSGDALDCVGSDVVTASYRPDHQLQLWDLRFTAEPKDVIMPLSGGEFYCCQFSGNRDVNAHFDTSRPEDRACFLAAGGTGSPSLSLLDHKQNDELAVTINDLPGGVVSLDFCPRIFSEPVAAAPTKSTLDSGSGAQKSPYAHLKEKHAPGERLKRALVPAARVAIACRDSSIRVVDIHRQRSGGFAFEDEEDVEDGERAEGEGEEEEDEERIPIIIHKASPASQGAPQPLTIITVPPSPSHSLQPPSSAIQAGAAATLSPSFSEGSLSPRSGFTPRNANGAVPALAPLSSPSSSSSALKHSESALL